jgi:threonine synthase
MSDPHTAVGIKVAAEIMEKEEWKNTQTKTTCVILYTAHPAKFPEAVMAACAGQSPKIPAKMEGILTAKEWSTKLPNCLQSLCAFVMVKSSGQI